jgi:hypothetical protein
VQSAWIVTLRQTTVVGAVGVAAATTSSGSTNASSVGNSGWAKLEFIRRSR